MSDEVKRWTVKKDEQGMYLDNGLDVDDPPVGTVLLEPADPLSAAGMRDEIARLAAQLAEAKRYEQMWLERARTMEQSLEMVRDADDDCRRDGLPTIPPAARATIDEALRGTERTAVPTSEGPGK